MNVSLPGESQFYLEYVRQLLELVSLMSRDQRESEEAEILREEMLTPWTKLTTHEVERVDGLSADLYMLTGEEILQRVEPAERTRARLGPRLQAAWERRNWDEVLALLRTGPDFLQADQLAYLRGRCWWELGHPEVALMFLDHASGLNPRNVDARLLALKALVKLGRLDEVARRAASFGVRRGFTFSFVSGLAGASRHWCWLN